MSTITSEQLQQFKIDLINSFRDLLQQYLDKPMHDMVRSKTVKEILRCSDSKLETLMRTGLLPYTKILGSLYFKRRDLEILFTQQNIDKHAKNNNV